MMLGSWPASFVPSWPAARRTRRSSAASTTKTTQEDQERGQRPALAAERPGAARQPDQRVERDGEERADDDPGQHLPAVTTISAGAAPSPAGGRWSPGSSGPGPAGGPGPGMGCSRPFLCPGVVLGTHRGEARYSPNRWAAWCLPPTTPTWTTATAAAAFCGRWRTCMAEKGYRATTISRHRPRRHGSPRPSSTRTSATRRTASSSSTPARPTTCSTTSARRRPTPGRAAALAGPAARLHHRLPRGAGGGAGRGVGSPGGGAGGRATALALRREVVDRYVELLTEFAAELAARPSRRGAAVRRSSSSPPSAGSTSMMTWPELEPVGPSTFGSKTNRPWPAADTTG